MACPRPVGDNAQANRRDQAIDFDPARLLILNSIIAAMMFGAALSLRPADFRRLVHAPLAPVIGLLAQFVVLPAATALATWAAQVDPPLALAMILVASCPGGNFSNIMTWLARGDLAVSIAMTAASSAAAVVMTPLNFAVYGWLNPATRPLLTEIDVSTGVLLQMILLALALPLLLGMLVRHLLPAVADRLMRPMRIAAVGVLVLFVGIAFASNHTVFAQHFGSIVLLAVAHNTSALLIGWLAAGAARLPEAPRRAVTMEVGIQNTGLGLIVAFSFFPDQAAMILLIAFWGVPHLVTGMGLVWFWGRRPVPTGSRRGEPG